MTLCGWADPSHQGTQPSAPSEAAKAEKPSGAAPHYPRVDALQKNAVPGEPMDEALGGKTQKGTPITPRIPECFPAESRDLFWEMDMVSSGKDEPLRPVNFDTDGDGVINDSERNAIRGRNTWLLWGGGNEGFWNWLAQDGYGITDFLVLLDSRARGNRFVRAGLINQPGFASHADPSKRILGLYLDAPLENEKRVLKSPEWDKDAKRPSQPAGHAAYQKYPASHSHTTGVKDSPEAYTEDVIAAQSALFESGDPELFKKTIRSLAAMGDGVDYTVYGFPSGVFGLRLFLNPDFFGVGEAPAKARSYWKERVEMTNDRFYTDPSINKDPMLVRPFRVSVSCGFCHVGPHPLNPPKDFEAPEWANLSSIIGAQYWKPQPAFGNLQGPNSFLHHFLASQQPGTVDTSLVSTDQINNANTMNAVFEINARLARAIANPKEVQTAENLQIYEKQKGLLHTIENPGTTFALDGKDAISTPRVLVDGSDSIGAFGALARVYLNIGTFYEEWATCHNPIIGFKKQRPFSVLTCQKNSVYWQTNEQYRAPYLAAYFTQKFEPRPDDKKAAMTAGQPVQNAAPTGIQPSTSTHTVTQSMKLAVAKEGDLTTPSAAAQKALDLDTPDQRRRGREVWLQNCAMCHSSKQPEGYTLEFKRMGDGYAWENAPAPSGPNYTLPMDAADWGAFRQSPAFADYRKRILELATGPKDLKGDPRDDNHPFWKDNFLSTDIRVPITLTATNAGRALATNGLGGHVWSDFSSITYKELNAVGKVGYFNPINGNSEAFDAPGGGRGYYRPATHVSLWATAPYLHNNTLGVYLDNPSVKGRMVQFMDGIRRMLWNGSRASRSLVLSKEELDWLNDAQKGEEGKAGFVRPDMTVARPGDLRGSGSEAASKDVGFIYRLPQDTSVEFAPGYARPLVEGLVGSFLTSFLTRWLWVLLVLGLLFLAWKHRPRWLGITLIFLAVMVGALLALSGLGGGGSTIGVLLMGITPLLGFSSAHWWVLALVLATLGIIFIQAKPESRETARALLGVFLFALVYAVARMSKDWWITIAVIAVALIVLWRSRPTLEGFSRAFFLLLAIIAAGVGWFADRFVNGKTILHIPFVNVTVGPLPISAGPIPRGTPVNLVMNMDPESPKFPNALVSMVLAMAEIKKQHLVGEAAWRLFSARAGQALLDASKCPDFVLDRGHLFGETLDPDPQKNDADKEALIAFLKTL